MWTSLLVLAAAVALTHGHGRVLDPPGRGSAWRAGFNTRANYDDDGLNCGGFYRQHSVNGGKCGLCGDAYDEARPRAHERGGSYDSGVIVGSYTEGSIITITVEITAHHLGYWEFKLCPDADEADQDCFDANPLELEEGGTKYYPENGSTKYYVNYRLPKGLTCETCSLQWRYTCGNNWGFCGNGTEALGCGNQETFGACSDIAITSDPDAPKFIDVDSLLLEKVEELDLVRLLLNGAMMPQRWVQSNTQPPTGGILNKPQTGGIKQQQSGVIKQQPGSIKRPQIGNPQTMVMKQPQKQRLNSKKPHSSVFLDNQKTKQKGYNRSKPRKNKRKKKTNPYRAKWVSSWR